MALLFLVHVLTAFRKTSIILIMNTAFYSYLEKKHIGINTRLGLLILFLIFLNLFDVKSLSYIYIAFQVDSFFLSDLDCSCLFLSSSY